MNYFKFVDNDAKKIDYADGNTGLLYAKELMVIYDAISTTLEKNGNASYTEWSFKDSVSSSRLNNYQEGVVNNNELIINDISIDKNKLEELHVKSSTSGNITSIKLNGEVITLVESMDMIPNTFFTIRYTNNTFEYINMNEVGKISEPISKVVKICTENAKRTSSFSRDNTTFNTVNQFINNEETTQSSTKLVKFNFNELNTIENDKYFLSFYDYVLTFNYNNELYAYEFSVFKSSTGGEQILSIMSKNNIDKNGIVPYEIFNGESYETSLVFKDENKPNLDINMKEAFDRVDNIITIDNVTLKLVGTSLLTDSNLDGSGVSYSFSNSVPNVGNFDFSSTNNVNIVMRPLIITGTVNDEVVQRVKDIGWTSVANKAEAISSNKRFAYKTNEFISIKAQTDINNKHLFYLFNYLDGSVKVSDIVDGVESNVRVLYNIDDKFNEAKTLVLGTAPADTTLKSMKDELDILSNKITNRNNGLDSSKYLKQLDPSLTQTERLYSNYVNSQDEVVVYGSVGSLNIQPLVLQQMDVTDYLFPNKMKNSNRIDLYSHDNTIPKVYKDKDYSLVGIIDDSDNLTIKYPITLNTQNFVPEKDTYALNATKCSITLNTKDYANKMLHNTLTMSDVFYDNNTSMAKQLETYVSASGNNSGASLPTDRIGFKIGCKNIIFNHDHDSLDNGHSIYELSKDKHGLISMAHFDLNSNTLWSSRNTVFEYANLTDGATDNKHIINYVINPYEDKLERFVGINEHGNTLEIDGVGYSTFNYGGFVKDSNQDYVNDQVSTGISNHKPMPTSWEDLTKDYDLDIANAERVAPVPIYQPINLTGGLEWVYPIAETTDGCLYLNLEDGKTYCYGLDTLNRFDNITTVNSFPVMLNSINIPSLPDNKRIPHLALDNVMDNNDTMLKALSINIFENHVLIEKSPNTVVCAGTPIGIDYLGDNNKNLEDEVVSYSTPADLMLPTNSVYNIIKEGAVFNIKDDKHMQVRTTVGKVGGFDMPQGLDGGDYGFADFTRIHLGAYIEDFHISTIPFKYKIGGYDKLSKVPKNFAIGYGNKTGFVELDTNPTLEDGFNRYKDPNYVEDAGTWGALHEFGVTNYKISNYHNDTSYTKYGIKHIACYYDRNDTTIDMTINDKYYSKTNNILPAHINNVLVKNKGIIGHYIYSTNTTDSETYADTDKGFYVFNNHMTTPLSLRDDDSMYSPLLYNQSGFSNNNASGLFYSKINFLSYLRDWRDASKHIRAEHNYSALI